MPTTYRVFAHYRIPVGEDGTSFVDGLMPVPGADIEAASPTQAGSLAAERNDGLDEADRLDLTSHPVTVVPIRNISLVELTPRGGYGAKEL